MNVLIVHAHPESASFNGSLKDLVVSVLTEAGHSLPVSESIGIRHFRAILIRIILWRLKL